MALSAGTRFGPYEILSPLGSGGMGEVYRARDTRLGREIALKVLPEEYTSDKERLARFEQEARTASALNHPNILTVYDVGSAGGRSFIAMELIDGTTLRERFDDRATEPRTLLTYLAQVAEGLAKAHAAGIVHRDLKPENVMVTRDGYAKILDFGLAKLAQPVPEEASSLPTAAPETTPGVVMGTVAYMSPEQAMGRPLDARTDVFAFGCLLYEAATGRRPFTGDSSVDVLHAIVREKPAPVEEIAPQIPRALVRTIYRCLAKDPERRYQSMKDLALELRDMVEEWETLEKPSGPVGPASAPSGEAAAARAGLGRAGWIAIAAGTAALAVAAIVLWRGTRSSATKTEAFQKMNITAATSNGHVEAASISPDGHYLVYIRKDPGGSSLWLRQLGSASDVRLLPPQGSKELGNPVFTPDGNYIDYALRDEKTTYRTLYRMPALGGASRKILDDVDTRVTYSPDGRQLAFLRSRFDTLTDELILASADGSGQKTLISRGFTESKSSFDLSANPAWSPDGRTIAAYSVEWSPEVHGRVDLIDSATGDQRRLGRSNWFGSTGLAWLPDETSLVIAGALQGAALAPQLWLLSYPGGPPTRITNDSQRYFGVSVSADGKTLASVQKLSSSTLWSGPPTAAAAGKQLTFSSREQVKFLTASADGTLFFSRWRSGEATIARLAPGGGEPIRVTSSGMLSRDAQISRDGRTLVVRALMPDQKVALVAMDRDGSHQRRLPERGAVFSFALAPDGSYCAVRDQKGIWRQPLDGGTAALIVADPRAFPIAFSPDGGRLAYLDLAIRTAGNRPNKVEALVMPAEGGAPLVELPFPPAENDSLRWAPDGTAFTFLRREGDHNNVWRQPLDGGAPSRITNFDSFEMGDYLLSPDGKTLYYTKVESTSDAVLIENFR
jgi:eukaryotic-like serine/threonine-protein kinase